jgi:hypothetical protein
VTVLIYLNFNCQIDQLDRRRMCGVFLVLGSSLVPPGVKDWLACYLYHFLAESMASALQIAHPCKSVKS